MHLRIRTSGAGWCHRRHDGPFALLDGDATLGGLHILTDVDEMVSEPDRQTKHVVDIRFEHGTPLEEREEDDERDHDTYSHEDESQI